MEWRVPWPCREEVLAGGLGWGLGEADAAFNCDAHGRWQSLGNLDEFSLVGGEGRYFGAGRKAFLNSEREKGRDPSRCRVSKSPHHLLGQEQKNSHKVHIGKLVDRLLF